MNIKELNIKNLTSLWILAGLAAGDFTNHKDYATSRVEGSEWPNKLWFHYEPTLDVLDEVLQKVNLQGLGLTIWNTTNSQMDEFLEYGGGSVKSCLSGMHLRLQGDYRSENKLTVRRVNTTEQAKIWSKVFYNCFGYLIDSRTVELTMNAVRYFLGYNNGEPVGTAVLFLDSQGTAGIHSMGVLPEQRRRGFAEELLLNLLKEATSEGAIYATLQASELGKGIYQRLGFTEDFKMKNYSQNLNTRS
jgi:ribosomal protein S18 acetylase RimI-like enzyme